MEVSASVEKQQTSDPPKVDTGKSLKRYRQRKRHKFNAIRSQMEFYFSQSNLSKDKYLQKLLSQSSYVPFDEFLKFNKIKALCNNSSDIAKALSNSELLEVSDDGLSVKRKLPFNETDNSDEFTIYVESIPLTADHSWIRKIFSPFGKIVYISLPRYSKTKKLKQFGFIEFEQKSSVKKVLSKFREFNGVLHSSVRKNKDTIAEKVPIKVTTETVKPPSPDVEPETKRIRLTVSEPVESVKLVEKNPEDNTEAIDSNKNEQTESDNASEVPMTVRGKKLRTRSRKVKKQKALAFHSGDTIYDLKVMEKSVWNTLRDDYRSLQKVAYKEVKAAKRQSVKESNEPKIDKTESNSSEAKDNSNPPSNENIKTMNFYVASPSS